MLTSQQLKERQKFIVKNLSSGKMSMVELGKKFSITRERVSQIYYMAIKAPHRGLLLLNRKERQQQKKEAKLNSTKFNCSGCGKAVTYRNGKYKRTYCVDCHLISKTERRAMDTILQCSNCGKQFHPFYNAKLGGKRKIGYFCSRKCYNEYPQRKKIV